jgi:hypothetical protein
MSAIEHAQIDFAVVADRAEVVNGKLYMMGAGWDSLNVVDFKQPISFSLAVGILIPWNDANEVHPLTIDLEDADKRRNIMPTASINITTGRPPGAVRGQSFRSMIAINAGLTLPGPGTYMFVISLADVSKQEEVSQKSVVIHARHHGGHSPQRPA